MTSLTGIKLSLHSPAAKLLREKLLSAELTGSEAPMSIWESSSIFQGHKLTSLLGMYHSVRKSLGISTEGHPSYDGNSKLGRRTTEDDVARAQKGPRLSLPENSESEEDTIQRIFNKNILTQPLLLGEFIPLYMLSTWKEPGTLTRRITVALVWPSGVKRGGLFARVDLDGTALELVVKWPKPLVDLDMIHKKWLGNPTIRYKNIIQNTQDLRSV